jgi:hypothetical protein
MTVVLCGYDDKEIAMAIAPIEDLFTDRLHQAHNRSMLAGGPSSTILRRNLRVIHFIVGVLKWFVPSMKV